MRMHVLGVFSLFALFGCGGDSDQSTTGTATTVTSSTTTTVTSTATTETTASTTSKTPTSTTVWTPPIEGRWVPAEWDEQEAIWLQWPRNYENMYEPAFAQIVATILDYEDVHILVHDNTTKNSAEGALESDGGLSSAVIEGGKSAAGFAIIWHQIRNDSAWMRDNGPVYVIEDSEVRLQDWKFDAWGGAFGNFPYADDDAVPIYVGDLLGMPIDSVDVVHERGNLEFNGRDAVILNWSVIGDPNRNPGMTREHATELMKEWFGVERVVLVEGVPSGDLTNGHIDGIARFIDHERVVVADCGDDSDCQPGGADDQVYDGAAEVIEAAGFEVIRWPFPGAATYLGASFDTDYLNWIVGNGFVVTVGFDHPKADAEAQAKLAEWFPGRDVHVIEMLASWYNGGGVHCHTNDQPVLPQFP